MVTKSTIRSVVVSTTWGVMVMRFNCCSHFSKTFSHLYSVIKINSNWTNNFTVFTYISWSSLVLFLVRPPANSFHINFSKTCLIKGHSRPFVFFQFVVEKQIWFIANSFTLNFLTFIIETMLAKNAFHLNMQMQHSEHKKQWSSLLFLFVDKQVASSPIIIHFCVSMLIHFEHHIK